VQRRRAEQQQGKVAWRTSVPVLGPVRNEFALGRSVVRSTSNLGDEPIHCGWARTPRHAWSSCSLHSDLGSLGQWPDSIFLYFSFLFSCFHFTPFVPFLFQFYRSIFFTLIIISASIPHQLFTFLSEFFSHYRDMRQHYLKSHHEHTFPYK
jgi:hypothetical protein